MTEVSQEAPEAPENTGSTFTAGPARRRLWPRWPRLVFAVDRQALAVTEEATPAARRPASPRPHPTQSAGVAGDRRIRRSSIATILIVAVVGTAISSWHAFELVHAGGEPVPVALGYPLLIDGVIFMASMNVLQAARRGRAAAGGRPVLAWVALILGALVTLAVNVAYGWDRGLLSQLLSAIPPLAVICSYELLMKQIRQAADEGSQAPELPVASHPQPIRNEVAEPPATPAPVARTLAEAVLAARADGESIRGVARAFDIPRSKVESIIRQAEGDDEDPAETTGELDTVDVIRALRELEPPATVNGSGRPGATLQRSGLGGDV